MKKVLLVEDDLSLGSSLQERLSVDFTLLWAKNQQEAVQLLEKNIFDLAILDVGLPDGSGFSVAENILKKMKTAIIFLTAQSDAESRLRGYELGAHEFVPKPFHLKELLIRIQHVMDSHTIDQVLQLPDCQVYFNEMKIKKLSGEIEFPSLKDLKVLELLIKKAPEAVSRDQILDEVWGPEKEINHRTVDNVIVRLKKVLSDDQEKLIRSVRGFGYQWVYKTKE